MDKDNLRDGTAPREFGFAWEGRKKKESTGLSPKGGTQLISVHLAAN